MSQPTQAEPSPTRLNIARRLVDGILVVAVAGEIDVDSAPELHAAVSMASPRPLATTSSWT